MATAQTGFIDAYHSAHLQGLAGTAYPAPLAGTYLALYGGSIPLSDGSGGTEFTGTRPAVTLGATQIDTNGHAYVTNTAPVTVTLASLSGGTLMGFGICAAATGGTPVYVDRLPSGFQVGALASVTIPAGALKIYAEAYRL